MEVSSDSKKMLFTLLEGWESLGSVAHAACGAHWQRLLGMPGVRELQRRKFQEKLLNSGSSFQEMPLVQVTVSERSVRHFHNVLVLLHWGASKAPSEEGTQVWFWPDPAGMFSDLYGILRWEP